MVTCEPGCRHRCPECRMGLGSHLTCDPQCDVARFEVLKAAMEPEWCEHGYRPGACLECGDYGQEVLDRWNRRKAERYELDTEGGVL